ncbi:hypothetical protein LEADMMO150B3_23105 [Leclercia adecarboxylata]
MPVQLVPGNLDCYSLSTMGNACIWGIGGGSVGTELQWSSPVRTLDPNLSSWFSLDDVVPGNHDGYSLFTMDNACI